MSSIFKENFFSLKVYFELEFNQIVNGLKKRMREVDCGFEFKIGLGCSTNNLGSLLFEDLQEVTQAAKVHKIVLH